MKCGPSLPPGVAGSALGTLTIRLIESSVSSFQSASACFQFWGSASVNEIALFEAIEMPLLGSISSLEKYLRDASPLAMKVMGRFPGNETNHFIGISHVDITLAILMQSPSLRLRHRVYTNESEKEFIGFIVLDVTCQIGTATVGSQVSFDGAYTLRSFDRGRESESRLSDASVSHAEEHHSLLDELLDLCADDLTVPTIDDASTSFVASNSIDPFETWLSRIERKAASPPKHSSDHSQCSALKIELTEVLVSSDILDSLNGKIRVYLSCDIRTESTNQSVKPLTSDFSAEFVVGEHTCGNAPNTKVKRPAKRTISEKFVQVLDTSHDNGFEVKLGDGSSVEKWLDGNIQFRLSYAQSEKNGGHVANSDSSKTVRVCIATATKELREVLSKDQGDESFTVDLAPSKSNKANRVKAASLSLSLNLVPTAPAAKSSCECEHNEMIANTTATQTVKAEVRVDPHPVSVFLSNFANAAKSMKREEHDQQKHQQHKPSPPKKRPCADNRHQCPENDSKTHDETPKKYGAFRPVRPPPLWICVVVSKVELDEEEWSNLKLKISCTDAFLPVNNNLLQEQPFDTQCSWQLALKEDSDGANVNVRIDLMCKDLSKAVVRPQFDLSIQKSKFKYGSSFPSLVKSSWCDVLDSTSNERIGKVLVEVSVGTLKFIRGFPIVCRKAPFIQRWWRRRRQLASTKVCAEVQVTSDVSCGSRKSYDSHEIDRTSEVQSSRETERYNRGDRFKQVTDPIHANDELRGYSSDDSREEKLIDGDVERLSAPLRENADELLGSNIYMQRDEAASSPDSLFEEWSQSINNGTLPTGKCTIEAKNGKHPHQRTSSKADEVVDQEDMFQCGGPGGGIAFLEASPILSQRAWGSQGGTDSERKIAVDPPASDDCSNGCENNDEYQATHQSCIDPGQKNHSLKETAPDPSEASVNRSTEDEELSHCMPQTEEQILKSTDSVPDQFNAAVHVLEVSGLKDIVTQWCELQKISALPVSGLFISFGSNFNACEAEALDEIHQIFFSDNGMHHSQLITFHECSRELKLENFKATVSILNCESNLQMIQAQTLSFKLWFVPVVTSAVVASFIQGQAAANKSNPLNGCSVVAIASVPLYRLYTPQTSSFEGKVAWKICGIDRSAGYIATVLHRLDGTSTSNSPLYEMHCEGYPQVQMSTIKPLNLSRSYSPETTKRRSVDPPSCSSSPKKRKVDATSNTEHFSFSRRKLKRPRPSPSMTQHGSKPKEEAAMMSDGPVQQEVSNCFSRDIHTNEEGISSQCSQHSRELEESNSEKPNPDDASVDKSLPCVPKKKDASNAKPGAKDPMNNTTTPTQVPSQPERLLRTCEKGSSPILVTLRCADASTSPCGEPPTTGKEKPPGKPTDEASESGNHDAASASRSNQSEYIDNSKDIGTRKHSNENSLHRHLGHFAEEIRGSAMPHRLRSKVMQNYFSGQNVTFSGTFGGYRSVNAPILSPTARNLMNLRPPIASRNPGVRSPLRPLRSPLQSINSSNNVPRNVNIGNSKPTAGSPTGFKTSLSNRERIERIFSGKK